MAHLASTIAPAALQSALKNDPSSIVLDVRSPAEFHEVHVPHAVNFPLGSLDIKALEKSGRVSRDKSVYLLCQSGRRAAAAAEKFSSEGFENVFVIEGGTLAWAEAGLPVNRSGGKAISIERQVRIGAGSLVVAGVVLGLFVHPGFFGLSAFVGAGLVFAGITDFCGMGLLLAKAPWNR
ncbi:MAG: rhodanese-like domain-containing protein [Terrimicrobiaceae bacterium]